MLPIIVAEPWPAFVSKLLVELLLYKVFFV